MKNKDNLLSAEIYSDKNNEVGTELKEKFNEEQNALYDYSKALGNFISIYPALGAPYMQLEKPTDELSVNCITKEEVKVRLENFLTYKILSSSSDEKEIENRQTLQNKIDSVVQELKTSFSNFSYTPIICYGFAARGGKSFMFFGVQKCFDEDLEKKEETNKNLKKQIELILESKDFEIEPVENLFENNNTKVYTGVNFGFPKKDERNTNCYNELFKIAEEEQSDFTFLILAKPVSYKQRCEYKQRLSEIYKELQKSSEITKSISKFQTQRREISETTTTQEEVTKTSVMDKTFELGSALIGPAAGIVGGVMLGSSLFALPVVGKRLAVVGVPIFAITGAILGAKYLPEITAPISQVIHQTKTKKSVNIHSLTTTFAEEFGIEEKLNFKSIDLQAKELAELAEDAYNRFKDTKHTVWQTVITYSATTESVRNILHAKAGLVTGDGDDYAANNVASDDTPDFVIPDNFFRTDGTVYPNEISNFVSGKELGSILYLPNKPKNGFSIK